MGGVVQWQAVKVIFSWHWFQYSLVGQYFSLHTDSSEAYIRINHRSLPIIIAKKRAA